MEDLLYSPVGLDLKLEARAPERVPCPLNLGTRGDENGPRRVSALGGLQGPDCQLLGTALQGYTVRRFIQDLFYCRAFPDVPRPGGVNSLIVPAASLLYQQDPSIDICRLSRVIKKHRIVLRTQNQLYILSRCLSWLSLGLTKAEYLSLD